MLKTCLAEDRYNKVAIIAAKKEYQERNRLVFKDMRTLQSNFQKKVRAFDSLWKSLRCRCVVSAYLRVFFRAGLRSSDSFLHVAPCTLRTYINHKIEVSMTP
jgi:hypothetical protein